MDSRSEHVVVARVAIDELSALENICSKSRLVINEDRSLYDAMNIGLSYAQGKFVNFLNSGDELCGEIPVAELVSLTCRIYKPHLSIESVEYEAKFESLNHQSFFAPRDLNIVFNEKFGIFSDADWMDRSVSTYGIVRSSNSYATFFYGGISTKPTLRQSVENLRFDKYFLSRLRFFIKSTLIFIGMESVNRFFLLKKYR